VKIGDRILQALRRFDGPVTPAELAGALEVGSPALHSALYRLSRRKLIQHVGSMHRGPGPYPPRGEKTLGGRKTPGAPKGPETASRAALYLC